MSGTSGSTDPIAQAYEGIPNWVGFGFIIVAGIGVVIVGAILPSAGVISFGVATVASAIIAWVSGARAKPTLDPFKRRFGGTVKDIEQIPWIIIFGLYVAAVIITIVTA